MLNGFFVISITESAVKIHRTFSFLISDGTCSHTSLALKYKGKIVAVEAGPNNWKLDREAYPIFEEAAKEAAWNTKHVDTEEELVITIPVSIVMLSSDKPKKQ